MDYKTFFKNLKSGNIHGTYLFHGDEEYVKDSALSSLTGTLNPVSRDLNLQVMEEFHADDIISACDALPFFDERRMVVCRALPTGSDAEQLLSYLPHLPESTLLIFFIRGKSKETFSIVKAIKAANGLVLFDPLPPEEAAKWVFQNAKKHGCTISESAARHLVALSGTDIATLNLELAKAAAYSGFGNEITKDAISACVRRNLEVKVFAMMECFLAGKGREGLLAYSRMLSDGESPFGMASLMESRFRQMLSARDMLDNGMKKEQVIKAMGNSFPAKMACNSATQYSRDQIISSLKDFSDVGYLQISGQQDAKLSLEQALIRCMPTGKLY